MNMTTQKWLAVIALILAVASFVVSGPLIQVAVILLALALLI
jgi:hypothetical protein